VILLDTQAAAWMVAVPENLSPKARQAITAARKEDAQGIAIADKTLWELAMMVTRKRIGIATTMQDFLQEMERVCTVIPINAAIAERSMTFSQNFPKDPADRIIGATAIIHGLQLVTSDWAIRISGEVPCVW
jgi:PIN domain nuclease of toxin-antitoxin system